MIRVLIADDQELVRAGFRMILDAVDDIEVIAEASTGAEAVEKAKHLRPDVCLIDIRMPEMDGIEATEILAGRHLESPMNIVIVTTLDLDEHVYGAINAGAKGFLLKNAGPDLLIEAVRAANDSESLISPSITTRLLTHVADTGRLRSAANASSVALTEREEEVLRAVASGLTNAEIARDMFVSLSTAKAHIASLMSKIDARNRVEIVIWAYETGRV